MNENTSKVYVLLDDQSRIIRCEGGYTTPNDLTDWVQIDEGTGDRYNLCQSHYFDGGLYTDDGFPRYKLADGAPVLRSDEEIEADRAAIPAPELDITPQLRVAAMAFVASATTIPDAQALEMPDLFPTWETVLAEGKELVAERVISKDGQLHRVVQAVTPQEHQPPDGEGMLAIYRPINPEHAGDKYDPIPYSGNMELEAGLYYTQDGVLY
ncbi:MAG TPA: hypothetical protein H9745_02035, partial [Candidatus Agathobaculum stercoravium]|nr:hypothetical protein [Candidatus Agathobaculum stercoravium]